MNYFLFSLSVNYLLPAWPAEYPSTIYGSYTQPYGLTSQLINMN